MKKTAIILIAGLALAACKKKKQYSHWKINGVAYSSNNVTFVEAYSRPISIMASHDHDSRFDLSFHSGVFPTYGSWPLADIDHLDIKSEDIAILGFNIGPPPSVPYVVSRSNRNTIQATEHKDKVQYVLPPTWFVNYNDPTGDSVLIEGTFNQP